MKAFKQFSLLALTGLALLSSCKDNGSSGPQSEYDRAAMLANYADHVIVPGYESFKTKATEMSAAVDAFTANPTAATLAGTREAFQGAYLAWQDVSTYNFGPADEQMLRSNLNVYPATVSQIESNIASGSYDLQASANLSAKGFPAIDYLLYSSTSDTDVLALYTSDANAANRKNYLKDVSTLVKQRAEATYSSWTTNYTQTFKQAAGTAVGSSVGNLVNELNSDIDLTKRAKVGIPSGRFTSGSALPDKVEAYYSKNSLVLLKRAVQAEKAIFMGMSAAGANGPGLDDYLDHVNAKYGNGLLSDAIEAQFDVVLAAIDAVPAPLSEAVVSNPQLVTKVYDELQQLIVLTKTDMPSALGVSITYTDNDGD